MDPGLYAVVVGAIAIALLGVGALIARKLGL